MSKLKGSQTEVNILTAFAGESQARNRYTYFAKQAKKDGYEQINGIFLETADQEKEHAKRLFKFLEGGELEITAAFPAGRIGTTPENLVEAAAGEHYEHSEMYPGFAKIAEEEGFKEVAAVMHNIAQAEAWHEERYLELLGNIKADRVFKRDERVLWNCRNCGFTHWGEEAPELCPACAHPQAHFQLIPRNW